jgi:hydroxylamine reductase
MENLMFCYQCEQTAGGKGCTQIGVCGKTPEIAKLQDLLLYQLKGISCYVKPLIDGGKKLDKDLVKFVENSLFTTLTNVNFDPEVHVKLLKESQKIKESLRKEEPGRVYPSAATYDLSDTKDEMLKDSLQAGIMFDQTLNEDIRSLRSTILFGLKGISAYGHQARFIGYSSDEVDNFYFIALEALTDDSLTLQDLINVSMKVGEMSVQVMKTLDEANTSTYKNPSPQKVNVNIKKGPFIIISGHDLRDLEMLLQQTEGKA